MTDQTHSTSVLLLTVFLAFFLMAGCSENKDKNKSLLELQSLSGSNGNGSSQTTAKWGQAVWGADKWNP